MTTKTSEQIEKREAQRRQRERKGRLYSRDSTGTTGATGFLDLERWRARTEAGGPRLERLHTVEVRHPCGERELERLVLGPVFGGEDMNGVTEVAVVMFDGDWECRSLAILDRNLSKALVRHASREAQVKASLDLGGVGDMRVTPCTGNELEDRLVPQVGGVQSSPQVFPVSSDDGRFPERAARSVEVDEVVRRPGELGAKGCEALVVCSGPLGVGERGEQEVLAALECCCIDLIVQDVVEDGQDRLRREPGLWRNNAAHFCGEEDITCGV